jgi:hypothetical protein
MTQELKLPLGRDKEPEADDPFELVMTCVPGGDPELMATCVIEEYARMGMGEEEIVALFRDPIYQIHALYLERGEVWLRSLIEKTVARTGRMRLSVTFTDSQGGCDA